MTSQEQRIETRCVHPGASDGARIGNLPGVTEGLVRLSVGIEAPEDLIRDLEHALED